MRLLVGVMGAFLTFSSAQAQQVGFRPTTATSTATLSVSSVSSSTSAGTALLALVCNIGSTEAFVAIGPSTVTATTSGMSFPAGFCTSLQLNSGNYLAAVTSSSTTTLRVTYGSGTPPIAGAGSSGGGGGGGAVTIADGADVTQGAIADAAYSGSGSGTVISILKATEANTRGAIPAGTAVIGKVGIDQTTPGTTNLVALAANQSVNVAQINGVTPLMGNGVTGTGSPRVTVASDNTPFAVKIDQTTPGTTNAIRTIAGATGGGTVSSAIAPATPAGVNLKASAGTVFRVFATTVQATPVYIKLYNASSAPTCGSGTPVARFMVPVSSTAANGAGTNIDIGDMGAAFGTGIGYCVTGALADNDTTAITANNTLVNIVWN